MSTFTGESCLNVVETRNALSSGPATENDADGLRLFIAVGNSKLRHRLSLFLEARNAKVAISKCATEAVDMLEDMQAIGFNPEGLILDEKLPDGTCWRVVSAIHSRQPLAAIAVIAEDSSSAVMMWANAHHVLVLHRSTICHGLARWLEQLKLAVRGRDGEIPPRRLTHTRALDDRSEFASR
jgi:DNA-binding NtrC family response regulator